MGLLAVVGISVFLYTLTAHVPGDTEAGPIKVGFVGPLTGDTASIGTIARSAAELAAEEINAEGGINGRQLQMIYEDGQCSTQAGSNAGNKLINADKVTAIIGGACSTETAAFAPSAMQNKIVVIAYCSSAPSLSSTGAYFFRDYPSDAYQGKFAAEYAYNTLGARKVAVVYHISDWGTGIRDVFEKHFRELGGEIVADEGTQQTDRDYRTALSKIKAAGPDLIYAPLYAEGGTVMLKQAKEIGLAIKFLGGDAWGDLKLQKDIATLGGDVRYIESEVPESDTFKAKLTAKTGGNTVPLCAPQTYDAVKILANALKEAGTDPDKLAAAVRSTKYDGVSGHVEFDRNGDKTEATYVVKKIAGGTAAPIQ